MWLDVFGGVAAPSSPDATGRFAAALSAQLDGVPVATVVNGRTGLRLILEALDLPAGGEVILGACTHESVPAAVLHAGLRPVVVDVLPGDLNVDPARVAEAIGPRSVAILATHALGRACDLGALADLAGRHGLLLLEDCAHAFGVRCDGHRVGTRSRAAFFSFAGTKPFHALGGGAVASPDPELVRDVAARAGRGPGPKRRELLGRGGSLALLQLISRHRPLAGLSGLAMRGLDRLQLDPLGPYRRVVRRGLGQETSPATSMASLQAQVGERLLAVHERNSALRRDHHARLVRAIGGRVELLGSAAHSRSIPLALTILHDDAAGLQRRLLAAGLDSSRELIYDLGEGRCPVATQGIRRCLHLPVYPELQGRGIEMVAAILERTLAPPGA